jgi:hypothetical protein
MQRMEPCTRYKKNAHNNKKNNNYSNRKQDCTDHLGTKRIDWWTSDKASQEVVWSNNKKKKKDTNKNDISVLMMIYLSWLILEPIDHYKIFDCETFEI